jgi:hypothetical protein
VGDSRIFKVFTGLAALVVLSAALTVVVLRSTADTHPDEWDARVLDLVHVVERERGALFDHPVHVEFLTPEEYSERTRTDEGALSDEEKAEIEQVEGAMRALGLLSGDTDLLEAGNELSDTGTLAYYDPADERVVVRGTEVTPGLAVTLVHELTHVLQDQVFDLDRYREADEDEEPTTGEEFAFDTLVEGDAGRIEQQYLEDLDESVRQQIDEEGEVGLEEFEEADIPAALTSLFGSIYGFGEAFVTILDSAEGESVDEAFANPPITEEQVLDPFAYFDLDGPDPVDTPDTDGAEAFDDGDFGAVTLMVVLAERIDPRQALNAAIGWGGDAYALFPRDGRSCVRLNVTGDTPDDTAELADAIAAWVDAAPAGVASTSRDGDIVHLESCDPGDDSVAGSGGSMTAIEMAVARTYIAAGALDEGAEEDQARCFGSALVNGLDLEEIASAQPSAALQRRVAGFVAQCQ